MKLIVDIPDREYKILKAHTGPLAWADHVLKNGTPLPKGHGKIIDADAFLKENKDYTGWILCSDAWGGENAYKDTLEDLINEAPAIIEADKGYEAKVITHGNCMVCGKELTEGLFFCKECEAKARQGRK